ncbi:WSC domain-containing protein [Ephemerocybe angulata]|uniref:WSC domain-containing protein n=1 Tax=Ephemerocybe angulata TaxID=980116 RepID=A0A8H6HBE3_9AGAR|nr:WSC domain-containing protein [Tulosesus angulatus]KAF6752137.1 WSC domain-containing protein [Tulosesus angulatus]
MLSLLALTALAALPAQALIRFPCGQLVTERFDPLVTPGQVSPHVHQIVGGNAFNLTMPVDLDFEKVATCTTCKFIEDKSNYWTAVLYFRHPNGSFIRVPQRPGHFTVNPPERGPDGGIVVYYIQPPNEPSVRTFPKGFRMITGNPMLREQKYFSPSPDAWALTFRCWEKDAITEPFGPSNNWNASPGSPVDFFNLPNKKCPGGIRSNIFFPSCWDGKNLDMPDHRSHVSYPLGPVGNAGVYQMETKCPESHPVRLPTLFYEVTWDTTVFDDPELWPTDGSQPFTLSMGDPTGYGHHGDYMFGWEGDSLQRAMDNCLDYAGHPQDCTELTMQSDEDMYNCRVPSLVDEVVEGKYLPALPGCNPLQTGPDPATIVPGCTAVSTTGIARPTSAST